MLQVIRYELCFLTVPEMSLRQGIGVVLISPEGKVFPLMAKLHFDCTHNIIEYETCIMRLQAACSVSIKKLKVWVTQC